MIDVLTHLADILADHYWSIVKDDECVCGIRTKDMSTHRAQMVLDDPDMAVISLPEPEVFEGRDGSWSNVWEGPMQTVQTHSTNLDVIVRDDFEYVHTAKDVAAQGAAFIAAARAAATQ